MLLYSRQPPRKILGPIFLPMYMGKNHFGADLPPMFLGSLCNDPRKTGPKIFLEVAANINNNMSCVGGGWDYFLFSICVCGSRVPQREGLNSAKAYRDS